MGLSSSTVESIEETVKADQKTLIADLVKISQTPAPTFDEDERARLVASMFEEYGVDVVDRDDAGNVIGRVKEKDVPAVCLVAHLDTVFDRSVDHTVNLDDRVIQGPGVGDDSLALATLMSVLRNLPDSDAGNLLLVATTGTEGDGNLRGSRHFVNNYEDDIGLALCLEGHRLGRIDHRSLGTRRALISASSEGGHVWRDETGQNPIGVLGELIADIREFDVSPSSDDEVVNLGKIRGGTAYNTVPYEAELSVEVRATTNERLEDLFSSIDKLVDNVARDTSVDLGIKEVSDRPVSGIADDHWLVKTIRDIHDEIGIESTPGAASSDSSLFLDAGIPTVTIGLAHGTNKHRTNETIEIDSLPRGQMQVLLGVIKGKKRCLEVRRNG